jgi:hypothetical protein
MKSLRTHAKTAAAADYLLSEPAEIGLVDTGHHGDLREVEARPPADLSIDSLSP